MERVRLALWTGGRGDGRAGGGALLGDCLAIGEQTSVDIGPWNFIGSLIIQAGL